MATREEFGKYLLLKKLTEDPLGETFRAGRVGDQGMEQVVLLRALNGPRLDTARLAEALPGRAPIQQGLKSPNIGNGVDLGDVKGVPFVAYDYISGKNLATLLAEARRQSSPIALDHALLIGERIAQALAVAYETRLGNERLLHGFVVPHLVRVSNEGETRLLGFEVGAILQEMAGRGLFEPAVSAYLAPEILAGEAPSKSDDVYSLGALLFQLLTGAAPTAGDPTGLVQEIDRAVVAAEESAIPAPVATLLKKSLTPRDGRVPEAVSWHKALSKIIVEGQYNATTFNLAFFMHNLFRSEIELETQELEAEKKIKAEERLAPPTLPETLDEPYLAPEMSGTHLAYGTDEPGGSKTGLWIGLAAVLLLAVAAGAWYFLMGPGAVGAEAPAEPATQATAQPVPEPVVLPPSPLDEPGVDEDAEAEAAQAEEEAAALQEQIQQMISESNQDLEAKLGAQYEARIRELQKQLAETQNAAERAREEARRQAEEESQAADEPEQTASPTAETRQAAVDRREPAAAGQDEPSEASAETSSPATSSPSASSQTPTSSPRVADTGTDRTGESSERTPPTQTARQQPTERQQPAPVQPAAEPAQVTPPEIVRQPQARYPEIARRMGRPATVLLRVLVDETGRVSDVERIGKRVGSGFDEAAAEAARQARYRPGTEDGRPKSMWTTLRIEFRPPS